ncbi:MAG: DNA-3-methyladenine glycosylase I [Eubacterium sp.]|jgi:DNA-3-methyladenine glycosylase I|nr:DNA-3-methyladenine glycosylase I [Eubacterium sp.]MCH4045881.1 DNA-3-methyladenine glycosylase I [Eubacterium sp.]MCH4078975.1 DNA-3-methyladenine glycosylase I [Eubacterium sp.]MCI1307629.1 DNA-3-methyladenine glycosylase I [Eubacterium sp.]MCI1428402.1 DNA-3-methyladenine glycosylase I [Eubacterium sp.]
MNKNTIIRCPGDYQKDPLYLKYHDEEWGRPCHDERQLYELFVIELFQAGLSWRTLLHKRENFRKAYDHFNLIKVANYGEEKIISLMQDKGIIRSERKIRGSIINSRIIRDQILPEFGSFDSYVWHFTDGKTVYEEPGVTTDAYSDQMSADLKKRGMKFAGSVSLFSYLQAVGVINSHTKECFCYKEIMRGQALSR